MILKVNNSRVDFFNGFNLNLKYDSVASTFGFQMYFNPDNPQHKSLFKPAAYPLVQVEHNDELLVTGRVLSSRFSQSSVKQLSSIGGYSLPGVLEDCEIPVSLYSLQSDKLTLKEIATKLLKPFGIGLVVHKIVEDDVNSVFDVSSANESQSVKSYLAELAAQKNIIMSHTTGGSLVFTRAIIKTPILDLSNAATGKIDVGARTFNTGMELSVNGQKMHSEISVIKQAGISGENAGEATVNNPFVSSFRPKVMTQSSGTDNDTEKAAQNALSDELRGIGLKITTDRWEIDGKIIKPDNIITVTNPELYMYKKTSWFIESIDFSGDNKHTVAELHCVLPQVYTGKTPSNFFNA